ncbi:MAG: PEP-CTERM sorting domain-containing protein [Verrucomicrobiales bacterium]
MKARFRYLPLFALGFSSAHATVMSWQSVVQNDADAMHLWSFEGATTTEQQNDSVGSNDLAKQGTGTLNFGSGYDGTSQSFTPDRGNSTAYRTSTNINIPTTVSFELILSPDDFSGGFGYAFAGRASTNTRNYFVMQVSSTGDLVNLSGNNFDSNRNAFVTNATEGDWYYLAGTLSYDGTNTTVNTWAANLSDSTPVLTQVASNQIEGGTFVNDIQYGVGMLNNSGAYQETFVGDIDEIALYSGLKDQSFFQSQLATILVPEPSALALLALGALPLTRRRR